jgi:hypothetical protein
MARTNAVFSSMQKPTTTTWISPSAKKTYGIDRYKWWYPSHHPAISLGFSMK